MGSGIRRSTGCALRTFFAYPSIVGQSTVDIFLTLPVVIIDARFLPAPNRTTNTNRKATHKPTTKTPESEKDIYYIYKNTSNPFWKSSVSLNRSRTSKHAQPHTRTFESKVYLVSQRERSRSSKATYTHAHTHREKFDFDFDFDRQRCVEQGTLTSGLRNEDKTEGSTKQERTDFCLPR